MSMLAEKKRKQKWSLNPRGKHWSEDKNKYGQKMLEKMGWSQGKGLGSNLHGVTEHVRVAYKNDQNGIGYKARDDQWTEHQDGFNSLLENLAGASLSGDKDGAEPQFKSLEEKSKVSRTRVHYAKFTRGKDLSRASPRDLANIFGKKTLVSKPEQQPKDAEEKEASFTKNGGSMFDYFKKKLPGFGKNAEGFVVGSNGVLRKDSDSEEEVRGGFGFKSENGRPGFGHAENSFTNSAFDPFATKVDVKKHVLNPIEEREEEIAEENTSGGDHEKRKKSAKRNSNLDTIEELDGNENGLAELKEFKTNIEENGVEESKVKTPKTKKRKSKIVEESPEQEQSCSEKKKHFENTLCTEQLDAQVENPYEVVRKNKKKKNENTLCTEQLDGQVENPYEVVRKDKKKKKKSKVAGVTQETPESKRIYESIEETHVNENQCFEEETGTVDEGEAALRNPYEVVRKRNKRKFESNDDSTPKSQKKRKLEASENPTFDITVNDSRNNNEFEVVRKKKKKQVTDLEMEISAVDNPTFDTATGDDSNINNNAFEVSRKKKKKTALDNPTFTEDCPDLQDNNTFEVPRKVKKNKASSNVEQSAASSHDSKKTKKKKTPSDNATFNEDDSRDDGALEASKKDEEIEESDLMLNVTATPKTVPILKSSTGSTTSTKRRSVRFSAVNEERTIPNLDDLAKNELFDINSQIMEKGMTERMEAYRRKIEEAQIQLENEMNAAKREEERFVGERDTTTDGEAAKLPDGSTRLKFKDAKFNFTRTWAKQDATTRAKAAYKKRIKGDIVVMFNNTNLHEIKGYATQPVRLRR